MSTQEQIRKARRRTFGHMPRLKHSLPGQPFDWNTSELVQWLMKNPKAFNLVFDALRQSEAIVFDRATGQWKGCDTP